MKDLVQITRRGRLTEEEFYPAVNAMYETIWGGLYPPQILTDGLSNTIRNNVVTPVGTPIPDCMTCGGCCASMLCVDVRPGEEVDDSDQWEIVPENDPDLVVDVYVRRNPETFACTALEGTVGVEVGCRIYDTRPAMCHHFEAGSDRCHAIRRAYGIDPFMSLDEMTAAAQMLEAQQKPESASNLIRNAKIERDMENGELTISVLMDDHKLRPIHRYDPQEEIWRQSEFDGLTIEQAGELIRTRSKRVEQA